MRIKRYEAMSMKEAIEMVKADLGPDAVILSTRMVNQGKGAVGPLGRKIVEVTAAQDLEVEAAIPPGKDLRDMEETGTPLLRAEIESLKTKINRQIALQQEFPPEVDELRYLAKYIEKQLNLTDNARPFSPEYISLYQRLIEQGVSALYARKIIENIERRLAKGKAKGGKPLKKACLSIISRLIRVSAPINLEEGKQKLVALMGPTGVGKTTTIAKLAAQFAINEKKRVGLITMDTYRVAAAEQLKIYARIIGLPLEVVLFSNRLSSVLDRFERYDLILIDTAGRSQNNEEQIEELNGLINQGIPIEKHLVVSATTKLSDLKEIARRFGPIGFDQILFTKLDESYTFGSMMSLSLDTQKPLSYVTFGQRVPEDIAEANGRLIGELTLGFRQMEKSVDAGFGSPAF